MAVLTGTNLSQGLGSVDVFEGISVSVPNESRIGLIGANGVGKTTLLRILAGVDTPKYGGVHLADGARVAYLRQEAVEAFVDQDHTVLDEMRAAFEHVHVIERRMREIEREMEKDQRSERSERSDRSDDHLDEYGHLQEEFMRLGGYETDTRIERTLDGLGFGREMWPMKIGHLSGGQKTRALLAKLLLEQPDVLILDEPTNHLDIEAIEWLEGTLKTWRGAFIISSHDRYFLDRVVDTIWEMHRPTNGNVRLDVYRGNYTAYLRQRQERFEREVFLFDQKKDALVHELEVIKRDLDFLKGANGDKSVTWVKGKLKRLTRDVIAIEQLGMMAYESQQWMALADQIEGSTRPWGYEEAERRVRGLRRPSPPPRINMMLKPQNRGSEQVVKAERVKIGYMSKTEDGGRKTAESRPPSSVSGLLFECRDLVLSRTNRVALIGPNGAGKTTFVKTMLGAIPPLAGEIELGPSVKPAYFAQAHDELDVTLRVREELQRHWPSMNEEQTRKHLAQFLFRNDELDKYVSGLSGGEKARLALAILALRGANFLVLDEPTNHLDIQAQEVLQDALESFDGSILLVSHDRYLIDKLATEIWEIRNGKLEVFRGKYGDFAQKDDMKDDRRWTMDDKKGKLNDGQKEMEYGKPKIVHRPSSIVSKNAQQQREKARAEMELRIAMLEQKLEKLAEQMQAAAQKNTQDKVRTLSAEYAITQKELDVVMEKWMGTGD
ncbi:MAG TPA: ABC-F family ATP-binding cassette domain-containing protein [Thermoflexales bacterium]|nr:ABC-F family ATP-binding cassette domain-containing protein [Thermoflexales bacterium]HQW34344.1 ABC-F family ATP-binding cassette domain-containing protein [Thermoflexales bacterium]